MDFEEITEIFDETAVEMTSDPFSLVRLPNEIVDRVTEGDDDPRFATFMIESGWSKSKRYWGAELFSDVASEINQAAQGEPIVGYMGHIRPEDDPYTFPEIQLHWLGARVNKVGDTARLIVKAYVLPGTKGRDYLKRGLVKAVSWRGKVAQEKFQEGVRIRQFAIESIDLSRPRAAGMSARLVGGLTSEMEGGKDLKPEEIAALQENELKAHNSVLYETISTNTAAPLTMKISEMEADAATVKPTIALIPEFRRLLGLSDDVDDVTVLAKALESIKSAGKTVRDSLLETVLNKKFKDDGTRSLVKRLIVSEMEDVRDFKASGDSTKDEDSLNKLVNDFIDKDETIKTQVSEMEQVPASPPTTENTRGGRELKVGMQTSRIRVRSAR